MTTEVTGADASADVSLQDPGGSRLRRALVVFAAVVLACGVVLRLLALSPLWLDEAQTVEIAHRSVSHLFEALRHDGSPPLFYLLLHFWIRLFGDGTFAVRSLSGLLSLASLPLMWRVARRFGATRARAWVAVLFLAASPFAVRYATEARMYALVIVLVLVGLLVFRRIWLDGGARWIVAGAAVVAALLLSHYWSLFLVLAVGIGALVVRRIDRAAAHRVLLALVLGGLGLVPWLPTLLFQVRHTGAPWGNPPSLADAFGAPAAWSGDGPATPSLLLAGAYYALLVLAVAGWATREGVVLRRPWRQPATLLVALTAGTLVLGTLVNEVLGSAFAPRYTAVVLAPFLLAVAFGVEPLSTRWRSVSVVGVCVAGLVVAGFLPAHARTQADQVAAAIKRARPTDLVVFCPDQLGPAVHRLAPQAGRQVVFPTMGSPRFVDWVDYAKRNEAASPDAFARRALQMLGPGDALWLVYADGYPTFHDDCSRLLVDFGAARGAPRLLLRSHHGLEERDRVVRFGPR